LVFDVVKDKALAELPIEKRTFTSSWCLADAAVERSGWIFCWQPVGGLAYAQTPSFYEGKTIRIVIGSGGLYDLWARLLAKHMPKHIAGNPNMIVQNMPGAGGLRCGATGSTDSSYLLAKIFEETLNAQFAQHPGRLLCSILLRRASDFPCNCLRFYSVS
jgi:hypothetical protein